MKMFHLLAFIILNLSFTVLAQHSKRSDPQVTLKKADSLFFASAWKSAIPLYDIFLKTAPENSLAWNRLGFCYHNIADYERAINNYNKSLDNNPSPPLSATVLSRLARVYAIKNEKARAFMYLDKAIQAGYINVTELENHKDYNTLRGKARFTELIKHATNAAMPCLNHAPSREFDFWIGEWDVYPNGTNVLVGQSKIEMASGGCMILENWSAIGGAPNTGKSMNYVNPATGKWEQLWIGSGGINQNNPQRFVDGTYKDGAMRFTFEQVTPQGQKQTGRFSFFNEGPYQVRQFNEVSNDDGNTWTTVYDFVYKRKK